MIRSLFSIFDPCDSIVQRQLNWIVFFSVFVFLIPKFWVLYSGIFYIINIIFDTFISEIKIILEKFFFVRLYFISLFVFIFWSNFTRLIVYIFSGTRHISVNLGLSLIVWLSYMLYGWLKRSGRIFAHLVPLGSPIILSPVLVIIETVRNFIRPITLRIRLIANIIAGHVILVLIGRNERIIFLIFFVQIPFEFLEIFVSFIQAYVFIILSISYWSEVD